MGKRRPHRQEQEAEHKGNPTKGKCAQISMLPLCSRCADPGQSLFCSWGVRLANQGRTVVVPVTTDVVVWCHLVVGSGNVRFQSLNRF